MKKVFAIFAIAALTACGGASTEATTDSAAATVDTAAVAVDSAAMQWIQLLLILLLLSSSRSFLNNFLQEGPFRNFGKDFFCA